MSICGRCNIDEMDNATRRFATIHKEFDPYDYDERFFYKISAKFGFSGKLREKIKWVVFQS